MISWECLPGIEAVCVELLSWDGLTCRVNADFIIGLVKVDDVITVLQRSEERLDESLGFPLRYIFQREVDGPKIWAARSEVNVYRLRLVFGTSWSYFQNDSRATSLSCQCGRTCLARCCFRIQTHNYRLVSTLARREG